MKLPHWFPRNTASLLVNKISKKKKYGVLDILLHSAKMATRYLLEYGFWDNTRTGTLTFSAVFEEDIETEDKDKLKDFVVQHVYYYENAQNETDPKKRIFKATLPDIASDLTYKFSKI